MVLALFISGCGFSECGTEVIGRELSPSNKLEALIFERNCGATTSFVRGVAVFDKDSEKRSGEGVDVFLVEGRSEITVEWLSDQNLTIDYSGTGMPPFTQLRNWQGVRIEYK